MFDFLLSYQFIILLFLFSLIIQWRVTSVIKTFHKEENSLHKTGLEVVEIMMKQYNIHDVSKAEGKGHWVSDFYDPIKKHINLSPEVANKTSISALAIAAHETGHALQHHAHYFPIKIRNLLYPLARIGSWLGPILLIAGIYFQFSQLLQLGIYFYAGAVVFTVINLPVEFDASRRAMLWVQTQTAVGTEESKKIKKLLNAAAMTYVMAAIISCLELLRFIVLSRR